VLATLDLAPARPGPDTWAVVATMGHYDEDALEAALAHPEVHVALVASARRGKATLELLRQRGLDEATLARVRFPAGGPRGDRQEEIALFALTEIVSARRAVLRDPGRPQVEPAAFATDPVCGMPVDVASTLYRAVRGEATFYFCSAGCRERFEREPELYPAENVPA
jgi:xanthine dehydrogenase accessory factor